MRTSLRARWGSGRPFRRMPSRESRSSGSRPASARRQSRGNVSRVAAQNAASLRRGPAVTAGVGGVGEVEADGKRGKGKSDRLQGFAVDDVGALHVQGIGMAAAQQPDQV